MELEIIFQDNHILSVFKPQTMTMPALTKEVEEYIRNSKSKMGAVYLQPLFALDDSIGGVVVYCLTSKSFDRCNNAKVNGELEFQFYAVTVGDTPELFGGVSVPAERKDETKFRKVPLLNQNAINIEFKYHKISTVQQISLYKISTNDYIKDSIRFGMSCNKTPIFGDAEYGGDSLVKNTFVALYLVDFGMQHPTSGDILKFRCMPPMENKPWSYFDLSKLLKI